MSETVLQYQLHFNLYDLSTFFNLPWGIFMLYFVQEFKFCTGFEIHLMYSLKGFLRVCMATKYAIVKHCTVLNAILVMVKHLKCTL